MTDPRLTRLIAQHEDSPCSYTFRDGGVCGYPRDGRPHDMHGYEPTYVRHEYVPSFDVAEYVRGVKDSWADVAQDQQGPLL